MRVVHEGDTLANRVEVADSVIEKARGLMFRRSIPDDYALVFRFSRPKRRSVHMLFVRFPIDVIWLADETVERAQTLRPWLGFGIERADTIVELPRGTAADVHEGDAVRIEFANGSRAVDRP